MWSCFTRVIVVVVVIVILARVVITVLIVITIILVMMVIVIVVMIMLAVLMTAKVPRLDANLDCTHCMLLHFETCSMQFIEDVRAGVGCAF